MPRSSPICGVTYMYMQLHVTPMCMHVHALAREADVHVHIFVHDADICAALKHYMSIAIHPHSLALSIAASMHGSYSA